MNRPKPRLLSLIAFHMAVRAAIGWSSILLVPMSPLKCTLRTITLELVITTFPGTVSAAVSDQQVVGRKDFLSCPEKLSGTML